MYVGSCSGALPNRGGLLGALQIGTFARVYAYFLTLGDEFGHLNRLGSDGASCPKCGAARRVLKVFPVTRFRDRTCTNARRLPGVRWVKSIPRHGRPSIMTTCPRRMSVAFIQNAL